VTEPYSILRQPGCPAAASCNCSQDCVQDPWLCVSASRRICRYWTSQFRGTPFSNLSVLL